MGKLNLFLTVQLVTSRFWVTTYSGKKCTFIREMFVHSQLFTVLAEIV